MSIRDTKTGREWEFGSHWNRNKLRDEGTGIHWNPDKQMWEVKIVRHVGYFKNVMEATAALQGSLDSTEQQLVSRMNRMLQDGVNEGDLAIEGELK